MLLAEGKRPEEVVELLEQLHRSRRGALVSRLGPEHTRALLHARAGGLPISFRAGGRIARLPGAVAPHPGVGPVAILTAGTSDILVAEEARAVLEALGVRVLTAYDVGVAGLHRLTRALLNLERARPRMYIVCAGREGALPTVVAGLVRCPVVGVPTSSGYGRGARGEAALNAMLQSCAPIAVVNIDGGIPAGLFAAQLLSAQGRSPRAAPTAKPARGPRRSRDKAF